MTSPYVIREVDGDEHELEIRDLHDETFGDEAPNVDASDDGYWWLVYRDKQPVAFAGLAASLRYVDVGYLKRSGVILGHRGAGLQRRLIRAREAKARKLGWTHLVSDTSDNPQSANNLIRAGYLIYEPEHKYGFRHTIYWKKDLHGDTAQRRAHRLRSAGAVAQDQRAEDTGGVGGHKEHAAGADAASAGSGAVDGGSAECGAPAACYWPDCFCPEDVRAKVAG
jgi:GNAT superfamily N-acetyltransferase